MQWSHWYIIQKIQICNFVATQISSLQFCGNTKIEIEFLCCHKKSYWQKVFFVLPQLCKSDFCVATRFWFKSCGSTKSPKFLIFYTLKKEKIRGNSRQFFFLDFGKFRWFLVISVVWKNWKTLYRCSEIHFFQIKKNTNIIFFGWNCDRLHSQSAFPSPPCLLKCAPTPAGAELRTMHLQQTKSMCKEAAILSNQFIYAGTHSSVIISSTSCTKVVCLFWKGGPLFS